MKEYQCTYGEGSVEMELWLCGERGIIRREYCLMDLRHRLLFD